MALRLDQFIAWLASVKVLGPLRRAVGSFVVRAIDSRNGAVVYYTGPDRSQVMDLIRQIRNETGIQQTNVEAYQIFMGVQTTAKVSGDIAEVGVYNGGSAKVICEAKGNRPLHLFDTFERLPNPSEMDEDYPIHLALADKDQHTLDTVTDYLKAYSNVYFYKGVFPATAEATKDRMFSFVHLDVDLYKCTLDCLAYFYPRMSQGGIIVCHDYIAFAGVRKAADEFFQEKPEAVIELPGNQCLIVKL